MDNKKIDFNICRKCQYFNTEEWDGEKIYVCDIRLICNSDKTMYSGGLIEEGNWVHEHCNMQLEYIVSQQYGFKIYDIK